MYVVRDRVQEYVSIMICFSQVINISILVPLYYNFVNLLKNVLEFIILYFIVSQNETCFVKPLVIL